MYCTGVQYNTGMGNCRIGCLYVPDLPLQALLRAEPELSGAPVAVTESEGPRAVVLACSALAHRAGVGVGMTAAQARSLLAGLVVRALSAPQVRSAQAALLDAARSFSPRVALEPAGEVCLVLTGATNRDPAAFEDPDSLDLSVKRAPHLSFGLANNICLGAQLARAELRIAVGSIVSRFPTLRLEEVGQPAFRDSLFLRGLRHLHVAW